jgi:hypothetical protein
VRGMRDVSEESESKRMTGRDGAAFSSSSSAFFSCLFLFPFADGSFATPQSFDRRCAEEGLAFYLSFELLATAIPVGGSVCLFCLLVASFLFARSIA